jgi:hypothetical protein
VSAEPVTVAMLRDALGAASGSDGGATARLVSALESIGWRGGDSASAEEVAQEVLPAIASCVRDHGDRALMYRQIADVLRGSGPMLDGGMPPASEYLPAAAAVVRGFVRG